MRQIIASTQPFVQEHSVVPAIAAYLDHDHTIPTVLNCHETGSSDGAPMRRQLEDTYSLGA